MELKNLLTGIEMDEELARRVEEVMPQLNTPEIDEQIKALMNIETAPAAYQWIDTNLKDEDNLRMLACSLEAARRQHDVYAQKGIDDLVYFETMKCFTRFLGERKRNTGEVCFDRGWWTYRQTSMQLFRIGELEYEFFVYDDKPVLSIHIPSDAHFSKALVGESLREARAFMAKFYPEYEDVDYFCETWLLSPTLRELLHPESNIRDFQDRFEIFKIDEEAPDYLSWLFGASYTADLTTLKEETSLQRAVKAFVVNGGKIGVAYGYIRNAF